MKCKLLETHGTANTVTDADVINTGQFDFGNVGAKEGTPAFVVNLGAKPGKDINLATAIVNADSIDVKAESKLVGFDAVARATTIWYRQHVADNARIAEGVVLTTGTIKPRLSLLDAVNAKAKAWHERWDAKLAERALAGA